MILVKFAKSTGDLFVELKEEGNLKNYLSRNEKEFLLPLNEYLTNLLSEKNLELKDIVKNSNLNRIYVYQIFSGKKINPSRKKILAIGFAMNLNLEEMQYLLKYAKKNPLYPRDEWDSIIISAIEQKLNVLQTNELLEQLGEENFLD